MADAHLWGGGSERHMDRGAGWGAECSAEEGKLYSVGTGALQKVLRGVRGDPGDS